MHLWWPQLLFAVINYFQTMPRTNLNTGSEEFCGGGEMQQNNLVCTVQQKKKKKGAE